MKLAKIIEENKDAVIGFLFGAFAYNEANEPLSEKGLERFYRFLAWIAFGSAAYQYVTSNSVKAHDKVKFITGVISGAFHSHFIRKQSCK